MGIHLSEQNIALKEWAVAVKALIDGQQIMVLRKGGIAEETRDFQLRAPRFYLLPAYEHQKPQLLKEAYRGELKTVLDSWDPESPTIEISAYAEAVEDIELHDQETVNSLAEFHIWTDTFTEERLKWKKKQPLHLLLLRVYKLELPLNIPMQEAYTGCKSWVQLESLPMNAVAHPVLSDEQFAIQSAAIRSAILR